jgi:two-component system sensor histidine kinase ChvG
MTAWLRRDPEPTDDDPDAPADPAPRRAPPPPADEPGAPAATPLHAPARPIDRAARPDRAERRRRRREARADDRAARLRPRRRRVFSKLTARVLAINVLALLILVGGLLYLGRYEERLIQQELQSLQAEATIFAAALVEGAMTDAPDGIGQELNESRSAQIVRRLYETTETRIRLFGQDGALMADSRIIGGPGGVVEVEPLLPREQENWLKVAFDTVYRGVTWALPQRKRWPTYTETPDPHATDYGSVTRALLGQVGRQVWSTEGRSLVLGVAVPVQPLREVVGAVLVTKDTRVIEEAMQSVRADILRVFAVALAITVFLSIYLAGTVTRPIRRLALAAEQVRSGHGRQVEIPDLTRKRDEIGELSGALRAMTDALWARMDAIERFAADVAHEIKNPLTSLRSAVETTARVTDPDQQRRLMAIILQDVQRLDRLISDISDASRLDAELSRAEMERVDLARMMDMLAELYRATLEEEGPTVVLDLAGDRLEVLGIEDRLVQVFRNLISNAVTFSPPDGTIRLAARRSGGVVEVTVSDEGPGIPPAKLAAIFDRFYTERPKGEAFGTHSGLGLSISKQIVEAHDGTIAATNRDDRRGARFTVRIPAA